MFTQLFITTGLVIVPIFFLITTLRLSLKTMNFISPDSKERVEHSGLFLKGVFKITIGLIVLLSAIIFYVLGITFMTKELIFLAFAMNVFIMTCGLLSSMAYFILPTVSNLELRISNIKHIQYTPEKKEIFNQTKKSIILSSVLTIIFHIILLGLPTTRPTTRSPTPRARCSLPTRTAACSSPTTARRSARAGASASVSTTSPPCSPIRGWRARSSSRSCGPSPSRSFLWR